MASTREREIISEFIELYRDLPCLWDLSSETYKDTGQKKVGWEILTEKLKEIDPAANELSAKKKVDHLKYAYQRELKKVKESKRTGSATSEIYKPNLWYFEMMNFLEKKNHLQRSGVDSLMEEDEVEPKKRKRKGPKEDILETKKDKLYETAQASMNSKDSETNSFGTYVGQKLEQIESGQREIAEKLISDVLFLAKTNNLRFDSRIDTPSISRFLQYNPDSPHSSSENSNTNTYQSPPYSQYSPQTDHCRFSSISPQTTRMVYSPTVGFPFQIQSLPSSSHIQTPHTSQITQPTASSSSNSSVNIEQPPRSLSQYPQQSPLHHSSQITQPTASFSSNSSVNIEQPPRSLSQYPQQSPLHHSSQITQPNVLPSANSPQKKKKKKYSITSTSIARYPTPSAITRTSFLTILGTNYYALHKPNDFANKRN